MSTITVNTHEAKSRLSELIRSAEEGAEVIVARNGQPVARIVPWVQSKPKRLFGTLKGQISGDLEGLVGSDPDILAMFDESAESEW